MRQGRALLPLQIVPETPSVLSAGEHTGWNRSPQSKRAPPAGMPLGVLIRPGRRAGHAIGPSGDRHRHPVVLITRCYCVHPLSFLEPGGRLFDLFDAAGQQKRQPSMDCLSHWTYLSLSYPLTVLSAGTPYTAGV